MRVTEHPLQKSQLLKFYLFSLGYIEEKQLKLLKFSHIFYEISHDDSKDIFRSHNYGYFAFLGKKMWF